MMPSCHPNYNFFFIFASVVCCSPWFGPAEYLLDCGLHSMQGALFVGRFAIARVPATAVISALWWAGGQSEAVALDAQRVHLFNAVGKSLPWSQVLDWMNLPVVIIEVWSTSVNLKILSMRMLSLSSVRLREPMVKFLKYWSTRHWIATFLVYRLSFSVLTKCSRWGPPKRGSLAPNHPFLLLALTWTSWGIFPSSC
jgi:hypothetical protein